MIIKRFSAENFRNIEKCSVEFKDGVNLLLGNNAQGKTNAVEGIYHFARGKSFRKCEDKELLKFGSEGFRLFIEYEDKDGVNTLEYSHFGRERRRKKNGYVLKGAKEMIGNFRAVLFYPDDLLLVKASPEERRAFINVAIGQCYGIYVDFYSRYKTALENRNCLLKSASKGNFVDNEELKSWSLSMAEYASLIYKYRKDYIKKLEVYAKDFMNKISDGKEEFSLLYKSDITTESDDQAEIKKEYFDILCREIEREKIVGSSLYGIHRDDLEILINGKSARSYSSQGQQRSIVLALKLAEGEVNREICGEYPVFLFDDVLSELDEKRKKFLLCGIGQRQVIMTSCEVIPEQMLVSSVYRVKDGEYEYVSSYR